MKHGVSYLSESLSQTENIASAFAKLLQSDDIVVLYGDLGSGKTTFVSALAKKLKAKTRVISPTFILIRHLSLSHPTVHDLYHVDLYRLSQEEAEKDMEIFELLHHHDGVVVIEWAERIEHILPKKRWNIWFRVISETKREIRIQKQS